MCKYNLWKSMLDGISEEIIQKRIRDTIKDTQDHIDKNKPIE